MRENGGQYTHAAIWTVMALARLGSGDEAVELFHMVNPINHTRNSAGTDRYKGEPYVTAGDVYSHHAHVGRGGLDLVYRLGGMDVSRRTGEHPRPQAARGNIRAVALHPHRMARILDHLALRENPLRDLGDQSGTSLSGVSEAELDGEHVDPRAIPLVDDGGTHNVRIIIGAPALTVTRGAVGEGREPEPLIAGDQSGMSASADWPA